MTQNILIEFTKFLALILVTTSCASAQYIPANDAVGASISLTIFASNPESFNEKRVKIRGYFAPLTGDLVIYPSKYDAENYNFDKNSVFVADTSPGKYLRLEGRDDGDISCTQHYVELTGLGGLLKARGFYGIVEILKIKKFKDDQFSDEGEICYST